jgi:hypothetical protein
MDWATTSDDADVERQVPPHEAGNDVGNSQDIPPSDSQEVPQPDSHEVPSPESEDIPHPDDPALLVLKENEVWTIGMLGRIYLSMFISNLNTIYFH